ADLPEADSMAAVLVDEDLADGVLCRLRAVVKHGRVGLGQSFRVAIVRAGRGATIILTLLAMRRSALAGQLHVPRRHSSCGGPSANDDRGRDGHRRRMAF